MIDTSDPTVAALLAACIENPDERDCALRLADALQEQGDEDRAEFVRVCCKLESEFPHVARDPAHVPARWGRSAEYMDLLSRRDALLREHERAWRSAGKCPECGGTGELKLGPGKARVGKATFQASGIYSSCPRCWEGDVGGLLVMPPAVLRDEGDDLPAIRYSRTIRWRRGLIDRVEVPRLEDVLRLECRDCGYTGGGHGYAECPGEAVWRPTPWLRAVVRHHPTVTSVVPLDREPDGGQHVPESYDWWAEGGEPAYAAELPSVLFDALPGSAVADWGDWRKSFATREHAVSAMGRGVVAAARG